MWDKHPGRITVAKHQTIPSPLDAPLIHTAPYRVGLKQSEVEREEIDKFQKAVVAEPEEAKWASLIVFTPIKDGTLSFWLDYRLLNAVTVRESYLISKMDPKNRWMYWIAWQRKTVYDNER